MVALAGLVVILVGDASGGNMRGNLAALLSSVGFAIYVVCVRSDPDHDWSPILPGYAFAMILICGTITLVNGKTLVPGGHDIIYGLVHGGVFIVIGTVLFNLGSRSVPAVPLSIFAQSETVFTPVFIFIGFGTAPRALTLLGGAIIFTAIIGKSVLDSRPSPVVHTGRDHTGEHAIEPGPGSIA